MHQAKDNGFPERIIPDETPAGILALHLKRYEFASPHVTGKHVLDVACGVGYGSHFLAAKAETVVGIDIDNDAIRYGHSRYGGPANLVFLVGDATRLPCGSSQFNTVCSFETIEHLPNPEGFLREIKRVLMPGGTLIVSTPRAVASTEHPANPYHLHEWSPSDFERLLGSYFRRVRIHSQTRHQTNTSHWLKRLDFLGLRARLVPLWLTRRVAAISGVRATPDLAMDDVLILPGNVDGATEIIAVADDGASDESGI